MTIICPDCLTEMEPQNGMAHCESCDKDFQLDTRCPECNQGTDLFLKNVLFLLSDTNYINFLNKTGLAI